MALRDDLIPVVDDARDLVADLGLRQRTVSTRLRVWDSGRVGTGTAYTDTDTLLSPTPKVAEPPARLVMDTAGKFESGDLLVSKISATYTEADLTGGTLAAGSEWFIVIDSRLYRVVGAPEKLNFGWKMLCRRVVGRGA